MSQKITITISWISFLVLVLLIAIIGFYIQERNKHLDISFNGVNLKAQDYLHAKELNKDRLYFPVCDVESQKCIIFLNIEQIKKNNIKLFSIG